MKTHYKTAWQEEKEKETFAEKTKNLSRFLRVNKIHMQSFNACKVFLSQSLHMCTVLSVTSEQTHAQAVQKQRTQSSNRLDIIQPSPLLYIPESERDIKAD